MELEMFYKAKLLTLFIFELKWWESRYTITFNILPTQTSVSCKIWDLIIEFI